MTFIDTNVIIDVFDKDPVWFRWSANALSAAAGIGAVIDAIVVAELGRNFDNLESLQSALGVMSMAVVPLDEATAFLAGTRFQGYRRNRADDAIRRVLPDFFIGAHALTLGMSLLTRDPRLYRRYFPELTLITPETEHD